MSIHKQAIKTKLRFQSSKGPLTTEDLYDLPMESTTNRLGLKALAIDLQKQIATTSTSALDFLDSSVPAVDPLLQLRFDIVKDVIIERLAESKAKSLAKSLESQRTDFDELIKAKKQQELAGLSVAELEALRAKLG
jgi:hypothetical protein